MRYVAAYLLASLGGKSPAEADVRKVLDSVGVEIEDAKLKIVLDQLSGKDLESLISEGMVKLATMPSGGGGGGGAAAGASADAAAAPEEKKEEVVEESEESDDDMGFGLFD